MPGAARQQPRRISPSDISIERGARENNVGANGEPERVVADDRYLDEHAEDRDDNHKERSDKAKVHSLYLLVQSKRSKTLSVWSRVAMRELIPHRNSLGCAASSMRPAS
jgi:hypothetical protein